MSTSTDGQICFGILFEEDHEFPWENEKKNGENGEEEALKIWWRKACGYQPPFELFDKAGNYISGKKPDPKAIAEYCAHQAEFDKAHPVPVELVNYCSDDCPMYILSIAGTLITANRGYPTEFAPNSLESGNVAKLLEFCDNYAIEMPDAPKWYLSSYKG